MAGWLKDGSCEMAAMESTASYWKPLYNILESSGLNAMVVNARHMKAVPGRKMTEMMACALVFPIPVTSWMAWEACFSSGFMKLSISSSRFLMWDLGADYYNQFNKERKINAYLKKLKALGWEAPVVAA